MEKTEVQEREKLFLELYEQVFPSVAGYISRRGGSLEEAKDIFHDALIIYYEKERQGTLSLRSSRNAYIVGITRHLWSKRSRESRYNQPLNGHLEETVPVLESSVPSGKRLMYFLERAGRKCMEMLQAFYYEKMPAAGIAAKFGYGSIHSATVQKYKCLEKVREEIKNRSLGYEDFLE